jgi:hypothetical protein
MAWVRDNSLRCVSKMYGKSRHTQWVCIRQNLWWKFLCLPNCCMTTFLCGGLQELMEKLYWQICDSSFFFYGAMVQYSHSSSIVLRFDTFILLWCYGSIHSFFCGATVWYINFSMVLWFDTFSLLLWCYGLIHFLLLWCYGSIQSFFSYGATIRYISSSMVLQFDVFILLLWCCGLISDSSSMMLRFDTVILLLWCYGSIQSFFFYGATVR